MINEHEPLEGEPCDDGNPYRMPFRSVSTQIYANAFLPIFAFGSTCYVVPLISVVAA